MRGPQAQEWIQAICEEIESFKRVGVYEEVPRKDATSTPLPARLILVAKPNVHGGPARKKARIVICGNFQEVHADEFTASKTPIWLSWQRGPWIRRNSVSSFSSHWKYHITLYSSSLQIHWLFSFKLLHYLASLISRRVCTSFRMWSGFFSAIHSRAKTSANDGFCTSVLRLISLIAAYLIRIATLSASDTSFSSGGHKDDPDYWFQKRSAHE